MDTDDLGGSAAEASADVPLARFELRVDNVRHLFGLLSAIYNGRKDSFALIKVNHKGEPPRRHSGGGRGWRTVEGAGHVGAGCRAARDSSPSLRPSLVRRERALSPRSPLTAARPGNPPARPPQACA
jgi:hypothetical protein